jgi:hypothetical protein
MLVAGGWWLVAGGWWPVAGGWWLVAGGCQNLRQSAKSADHRIIFRSPESRNKTRSTNVFIHNRRYTTTGFYGTLSSVHRTLNTVHCTPYTAHRTLYTKTGVSHV